MKRCIIYFENLTDLEQVNLLFNLNDFALKSLPENKILYVYLDKKFSIKNIDLKKLEIKEEELK